MIKETRGVCESIALREDQSTDCWFSRDKISFVGFYCPGIKTCLGREYAISE